MASTNEPLDTPRRRLLIDAAGRLFRANGFRAVTMEMIAAEARVAKATLYSHFRDKAAVFAAVADFVIREIAGALQAELTRDGKVDERVARGLVARHRVIFQMVDGSPHARELMSARDSVVRPLVDKVDARMIEMLAATLHEDPVFAKSAQAIAHTLFRACVGVGGAARSIAEAETEIGQLVRTYLLGLRVAAQMDSEQRAPRRVARAGGRG